MKNADFLISGDVLCPQSSGTYHGKKAFKKQKKEKQLLSHPKGSIVDTGDFEISSKKMETNNSVFVKDFTSHSFFHVALMRNPRTAKTKLHVN